MTMILKARTLKLAISIVLVSAACFLIGKLIYQTINDNGSGNHTAISGGRKPTADSHAYTLYKPNKANNRGKFSNGGGSLSNGPDQSFDAGYGQAM